MDSKSQRQTASPLFRSAANHHHSKKKKKLARCWNPRRNIPLELMYEILSRLPGSSVLKFKLVCRAWRSMIEDPRFVRSHLDRQLSDGGQHLVFHHDRIINSFCFVPLAPLIAQRVRKKSIDNVRIKPFRCEEEEEVGRFGASSCHGIMFLRRQVGATLYSALWNPTTGESRRLPPHTSGLVLTNDDEGISMDSGFGYDLAADDYKAVNIAHTVDGRGLSTPEFFEAMVYSLKSDSWRRIKDFRYYTEPRDGVFLNGALHWIASTRHMRHRDLIVGVDLGTEDCFRIGMPLETLPTFRSSRSVWQLNVLGGCVSLMTYGPGMTYDLWLMKDYRAERSWTKLFSITDNNHHFLLYLKPVVYSESR